MGFKGCCTVGHSNCIASSPEGSSVMIQGLRFGV